MLVNLNNNNNKNDSQNNYSDFLFFLKKNYLTTFLAKIETIGKVFLN